MTQKEFSTVSQVIDELVRRIEALRQRLAAAIEKGKENLEENSIEGRAK